MVEQPTVACCCSTYIEVSFRFHLTTKISVDVSLKYCIVQSDVRDIGRVHVCIPHVLSHFSFNI